MVTKSINILERFLTKHNCFIKPYMLVFMGILIIPIVEGVYGQEMPGYKKLKVNQAEYMVNLLSEVASNRKYSDEVDSIMNFVGTDLIISQMNLMRKVSEEQYKTMLLNLHSKEFPDILPLDSSLSSKKGVEGLGHAWVYLQWALKNLDVLKERIEVIKSFNVYQKSKSMALSYLPCSVDINPDVYVVIGGRAGAAALSNDAIYYGLGKMSYLHNRKKENVSSAFLENELTSFLAHEMHHIGLQKIRNQQTFLAGLKENEKKTLNILLGLVAEGSATYLFDTDRGKNIIKLNDLEDNQGRLLRKYDNIIQLLLNNEIKSEESYIDIKASLSGASQHIAGTEIFRNIDMAFGINKVLECISDPRILLIEYNKSIMKLYPGNESKFLFDDKMVNEIYNINRDN